MARFTCLASYEPVFVTPTAELITVDAGERVVLTAPGSSVANSLLALRDPGNRKHFGWTFWFQAWGPEANIW